MEYCDNAVLANWGPPICAFPSNITYLAATYSGPSQQLTCSVSPPYLCRPRFEAFPCLPCIERKAGGVAPAVLNGAMSTVSRYLKGELGFYDIPRMVQKALDAWTCRSYA